jgi:hypothetical protein
MHESNNVNTYYFYYYYIIVILSLGVKYKNNYF